MVSRLAKSGIFLPEFHVPDFSRFLQHREMRFRAPVFLYPSAIFRFSLLGVENKYPLLRYSWKTSSKGLVV